MSGFSDLCYAGNTMSHVFYRKSLPYFGLIASASLMLAGPIAHAGDCGADPVYERKMSGKPTVGLRMRDIACMEGSKVLTVLPAGTAISIIGETDGWYKVKHGEYVGWMGASLIQVTGGEAKSSDKVVKESSTEKNAAPAAVELGKKSMVGILEKDYKLVEKGNADLLKRLKDKVLLRVQKSGETWYVEKDGKLTRVKMYNKNEFKRWNEVKKEVKEVKTEEKKEEKKPTTLGAPGNIILIGEALPGGVKLAWNISGDGAMGFKVVKSTEPNPEYPGDSAEYMDAKTLSVTRYGLSGGKTYHFRVCRYTGNGCDVYSNNLTLTIPTAEQKETSGKYQPADGELKLEVAALPGAVALSWSKRTSSNFEGYKVVRSLTNSDPSYPTDGYVEYLPNRDTLTHIDGTAVPGKTYYYRICSIESGSPVACGNVVKVVARQR